MSFLEKIRTRDAEGVKTEPVNNAGAPSNGAQNTDLSIGETFETTYVQAPRYEGGTEEVIEDEEREIVDRKHSEKALEKVFKEHITFKDWVKAVKWRLTK